MPALTIPKEDTGSGVPLTKRLLNVVGGASPAEAHGVPIAMVNANLLSEAAQALGAMESRANEYHNTTMQPAKRIVELEEAVETARTGFSRYEEACELYQMRILELERVLTREQRETVSCPCGGGPGHGADWCADYREGLPA